MDDVTTPLDKASRDLAVLRRARKRIAKPGNWCVKAMAVDQRGHTVRFDDPSAVSWSVSGALLRECGTFQQAMGIYQEMGAMIAMPPDDINEEYGHDAVIALFDHAITLLEEKLEKQRSKSKTPVLVGL